MRPPDLPKIPAIVLAAGGSARLGQPKQLLRLQGSQETLLGRAVRLARESEAAPIFVVLGADAESIQRAVDLSQFTVLVNDAWAEGMASSLRVGIAAAAAVSPPVSGALLTVCDQPAVSAEHLRHLLATHRADPESIAASQYAGRSGVPAVVPREMFAALLALTGDQGARSIFARAGLRVHAIKLAGGEWDIDTAEDLRRNKITQG